MASFVFIDVPHRDGWKETGALIELVGVAGALADRGHTVVVATFAHCDLGHRHWPAAVARRAVPIIERPAIEVAPGGLRHGRAAYDSVCVAQWLEGESFDVVVAAEARGIAAHFAMARSAGGPRIALWATGATRARTLADRRPATLADLVCDALERAALVRADLVFAPPGQARSGTGKLIRMPAPMLQAVAAAGCPDAKAVTDITLVGGGEAAGTLRFLDAIEGLEREGLMAGRSITLMGPLRREGPGLTRETIALRARKWTFPWSVEADISAREAAAMMTEPHRLPVVAGAEAIFSGLVATAVNAGAPVIAPRSAAMRSIVDDNGGRSMVFGAGQDLLAVLKKALARSRDPSHRGGGHDRAVSPWADQLETLARPPKAARPRRRKGKVSVCVTHRDRPELLPRALTSISCEGLEHELEVILIDDASARPEARQLISDAASGSFGKHLKVFANKHPRFAAAARNQAAAAATGDCLVFLDDDNWLVAGSLPRLVAAVGLGRYDVVTSALDVEQPGGEEGTPPLRVAFLGDAGLAGLVYNGFGDASLAIRREAFERVGGFPDDGVMAPAEDWTFLARCRAAGLRMASLWQPCFGYRKPVDLASTSWRKNHKEGALGRVREAYGLLEGEDLQLALAYLQGLDLIRQSNEP